MKTLLVEFVEFIPEELSEGVLYITMKYKSARHKCACGCGSLVITPITPIDWNLKFDGKTVSLYPSIGNWGFDCQSHYFIIKNQIRWVEKWSKDKIDQMRTNKDQSNKLADSKANKRRKKKGFFRQFKFW